MSKDIFVKNVSQWAPDLSTEEDWNLWAKGEKQISLEKTAPALEYTEPLFRRRLSQLSKMTVQVVHDLFQKCPTLSKNTKLVFISLRGEIDREFKINKSLIEDKMILPAGFSLSVFNAPIALSTIALGLKGGYSAIYPSEGKFSDALLMAISPVLAEDEKEIVLVYADELIPEVYNDCVKEKPFPLAFAFVVSLDNSVDTDCTKTTKIDFSKIPNSPEEFLKTLLK